LKDVIGIVEEQLDIKLNQCQLDILNGVWSSKLNCILKERQTGVSLALLICCYVFAKKYPKSNSIIFTTSWWSQRIINIIKLLERDLIKDGKSLLELSNGSKIQIKFGSQPKAFFVGKRFDCIILDDIKKDLNNDLLNLLKHSVNYNGKIICTHDSFYCMDDLIHFLENSNVIYGKYFNGRRKVIVEKNV
jgi:hypothetical protein